MVTYFDRIKEFLDNWLCEDAKEELDKMKVFQIDEEFGRWIARECTDEEAFIQEKQKMRDEERANMLNNRSSDRVNSKYVSDAINERNKIWDDVKLVNERNAFFKNIVIEERGAGKKDACNRYYNDCVAKFYGVNKKEENETQRDINKMLEDIELPRERYERYIKLGLSKNRVKELKYFALQYPEWDAEMKGLTYIKNITYSEYCEKTRIRSGSTAESLALRKHELQCKMDMVKNAIGKLEKGVAHYVFLAVTEGKTFPQLQTMYNIPCGKDLFYKNRALFFCYLNKEVN